jgi:endo-1,4-beta-xylanase
MKLTTNFQNLLFILTIVFITSCDKYERAEVRNEIYVNKNEITLSVGQSDSLVVSPTKGDYLWYSENDEIATVNSSGVITALSPGNTNVIVEQKHAKFTIKVSVLQKVPLTDIALTATKLLGNYTISLIPGATQRILSSTIPGNANDFLRSDYLWWSDNDSIAHVYNDGTILAVNEGSTLVHHRRGTISKDIYVYVSKTSPFKGPHIISKTAPLELSFLNFDYGGPEISWHDATPENQGKSNYRNDNGDNNSNGVDIEGSSNIGYTASGEWLVYTVDVQDSGIYSLDLCVSGSGGTMHYEVDGVNATGTISIKSTSGWGDYQYNTTSPKDLRLTAGRHKIKVVFGNAAFNIRSMRFTYVDDL